MKAFYSNTSNCDTKHVFRNNDDNALIISLYLKALTTKQNVPEEVMIHIGKDNTRPTPVVISMFPDGTGTQTRFSHRTNTYEIMNINVYDITDKTRPLCNPSYCSGSNCWFRHTGTISRGINPCHTELNELVQKYREQYQCDVFAGTVVLEELKNASTYLDTKKIRSKVYQCTKQLASMYPSPKETQYYVLGSTMAHDPTIKSATKNVDIVDADCLAMASMHQHNNVCVLNMACDRNAGGGVESGAAAQEETLFRRSNYCTAFTIPLNGRIAVTENVTLFRGSETDGFPILEKPFVVNMIAVAALYKPRVKNGHYANIADYTIMSQKIEAIFQSAIGVGCDVLVLGALGCGAFLNPACDVANIMKTMCEKYCMYFSRIVIAIMTDHNSTSVVNPNGIMHEFKKVFD